MSTDAVGNVVVWNVPPAFPRFCPLSRIVLEYMGQAHCGVTCSVWDESSMVVFLGNDAGGITAYSLEELISDAGTTPVQQRRTRSVDELSTRRRGHTRIPPAPPVSITERWKPPQLRLHGPIPKVRDPKLVMSWNAHYKGVRSMNKCLNRQSLVTVGGEWLVRMWSMKDGTCIGTLTQGLPPEGWLFDAGLEQKREGREDVIKNISSTLEDEPYKPINAETAQRLCFGDAKPKRKNKGVVCALPGL